MMLLDLHGFGGVVGRGACPRINGHVWIAKDLHGLGCVCGAAWGAWRRWGAAPDFK